MLVIEHSFVVTLTQFNKEKEGQLNIHYKTDFKDQWATW